MRDVNFSRNKASVALVIKFDYWGVAQLAEQRFLVP